MIFRAGVGISFLVLVLISAVPARSTVAGVYAPELAFAQAEKRTATQRLRQWTKARLEAAKKRWARNNAKFSACANELAESRRTRRITIHDQGHFLQECMLRP